ncbi:MAG TPA: hypothetical protein DHV08_10970 [Rhodocyclaceae bacterium]|nr:MAG: hypothetical protein AUK49_05045 [Betaproteobacteria bacterium CG2_30_68_42]PIV72338.1 MAG: hypothetical protein COW56_09660 [Rhodocyclales bacterium CG17_big_fil_post_rev_8_21_14_2_50_68_7]PJA57245.1 MAG: hypothetical protein CO164_08895 [Rhodocyclales bacterium CG_4_9_14_3_um_filter_68_10]HCX34019.1 hypothetical protein [Rhodocyclaceae bacterium]
MEWEFTPDDVVKGRSAYGLAEFRRDLAEEVRANTGGDAQRHARTFHLLYDLCHALATDKDIEAHLGAYAYDPPTVQFLREMLEPMAGNAAMLGAVLQRQIVDRVEAGMPLQAAIDDVAAWHRKMVSGETLPAH